MISWRRSILPQAEKRLDLGQHGGYHGLDGRTARLIMANSKQLKQHHNWRRYVQSNS